MKGDRRSSISRLEAERRVGWAKYYEAQDEIDELRDALRQLAREVVFDPRVRNTDKVLHLAQDILNRM